MYIKYKVSTVQMTVAGVSTYVRRIETNVTDLGTVSFGSTTTGNFSWGKIMFEARTNLRSSHPISLMDMLVFLHLVFSLERIL